MPRPRQRRRRGSAANGARARTTPAAQCLAARPTGAPCGRGRPSDGPRPRWSRPAALAQPPASRSPSQVAGSGALPRPELSLHGMQIHRAVVLVAMMLIAVGALVLLLSNADGKSLVALAVVVLAAIAGGIGFSWKRYYRR